MIPSIKKFINSESGRILLSVILGLGLATLFRKSCQGKRCMQFVGPKIQDIEDKVYKFENKCYSYKPKPETCNAKKKKVSFEGDV